MVAPHRLETWFVMACMALLVPVASHAAARQVQLIDAVKSGDLAAVRTVLAQVDVNAGQDDGTTPLHWAVHLDRAQVVDLLIDAGAKVDVANRHGITPLAIACSNGNAGIIERLLKAGVQAISAFRTGETPLMVAARSGHTDAAKVLLAHGADVNARATSRGQTALMWAGARGDTAMLKTLLEAGADVGLKTPSVVRKDPNKETDFQGRDSQTASGYRFAAVDPSGFSALTFAVREGHIDAVKALLDAGATVNDVLADGTSALVLAAMNSHFELAAYLLDRGADPNANAQGWTALHQVIRLRRTATRFYTAPVPTGTLDSFELIRKLIAAGAHVNARMWKNGLRDGQRTRFVRMGATPFLLAAKIADVQVMQLLLANGANPLTPTVENLTPLMAAAGVDLYNPAEDAGSNPEHMAERLEAVKLCVQLGADVNAVTTENETALHGAVYLGEPKVVEYLASKGAKLDIKNDRGWTPLAIARGAAWADFFKEYPTVVPVLVRLMTERGIPTEGHIADATICKECFTTRGGEVARMLIVERQFENDQALATALKNAR
jgi:uncharacterized protein